jgi:hypothetical protein
MNNDYKRIYSIYYIYRFYLVQNKNIYRKINMERLKNELYRQELF